MTALTAGSLTSAAQASPGQSVTTLRETNPVSLASELTGRNMTVRSATFAGADVQAGLFADAGFGAFPTTGVALSSGSLIDADPTSDDDVDFTRSALLGPNSSLTTTGDLGGAGDAPLTDLVGATTYDAATLTIDVVPQGRRLLLTYLLGSEEYATWAQTGYGDAFAIWVDGTPCSFVPGSDTLVGTSTVNASVNSQYYVANFAPNDPGAGGQDTEMNAFTVPLTCTATVIPRQPTTVRISVADTRDGQLDSTALLQSDSLRSTQVPTAVGDLLCRLLPWLPWCPDGAAWNGPTAV
ncbi:choice-of-anchor L domain-containing protein [Cellulomonas sp. Root485]|uniref:choice-of-anchor L domain-containing protein n=1 Tax=Cellulomonas sp. Root485 TaxID=1736546 RepID=UPI0012FA8B61|nr:choice-of-anchor L domain-containing protein [Cellulomonas sp. Root485]